MKLFSFRIGRNYNYVRRLWAAHAKLNKWGLPEVNKKTQASSEPWVYFGGDIGEAAETTVESVNDGKTAAWNMHKYLQFVNGYNIDSVPRLPMFHTPIDVVIIVFFYIFLL